jgi:hypothetical protein
MSTEPQLPAASFSTLVSLLATQAMAALGQLPDPQTNQPVVRLAMAKHFIDSLEVLQQKTKGNLADVESGMLENMLFELRMVFVTVQKKSGPA